MATLDTSDNPDDEPEMHKSGVILMVIGVLICMAGIIVLDVATTEEDRTQSDDEDLMRLGYIILCIGGGIIILGVILGITIEDSSPDANDDDHDGEIRTLKFGKVTIKDKPAGNSWKQRSTEIWIEGKWGFVSFVLIAIFSVFLTFYQGWFNFIPGLSDLEGNILLSFIASIISMILLPMMPRIFRIWLLFNGITIDDDEE